MLANDEILKGLAVRIDQRIAKLLDLDGSPRWTDRSASLAATGKPDLIRDIKRKRMPEAGRLARLAGILECRLEWLLTGRGPEEDERSSLTTDQKRWLRQLADHEGAAEVLDLYCSAPANNRKIARDILALASDASPGDPADQVNPDDPRDRPLFHRA